MAISLTLRQVRESLEAGYKVSNTIIAHTTITDCVFVFKSIDDTYDHIASVVDLITLPETKDPRILFYRKSLCDITYEDVEDAVAYAASVKSSLTSLVADYTIYVDDFVGSEDTVIT